MWPVQTIDDSLGAPASATVPAQTPAARPRSARPSLPAGRLPRTGRVRRRAQPCSSRCPATTCFPHPLPVPSCAPHRSVALSSVDVPGDEAPPPLCAHTLHGVLNRLHGKRSHHTALLQGLRSICIIQRFPVSTHQPQSPRICRHPHGPLSLRSFRSLTTAINKVSRAACSFHSFECASCDLLQPPIQLPYGTSPTVHTRQRTSPSPTLAAVPVITFSTAIRRRFAALTPHSSTFSVYEPNALGPVPPFMNRLCAGSDDHSNLGACLPHTSSCSATRARIVRSTPDSCLACVVLETH